MKYTTAFHQSILDIPQSDWAELTRDAGPFLQYAFLRALESSASVGDETGWQPYFLTIYRQEKLVAAMPGYIKYDSYGEYVFDHGWAHAYEQHGMAYYPKWISAVPFTPVTGPRLLIAEPDHTADICEIASQAISSLCESGISSAHVLFHPLAESDKWRQQGYLRRYSVQFVWYNYDYHSFSDFTAALTARKRKSLRKSREKLDTLGVTIEQRCGDDISDEHVAFFIRCYQTTYLKRSGHTGYLTEDFFKQIFADLKDNILLVNASRDGSPIASALFFFDKTGLYGRYWGALEPVDGLHFECCYNQGIAFAIAHDLPLFNPGTQGEHKILRGFEPTYCMSLHKLHDERFHLAVSDFLQRETPQIATYFTQAADVLPFNETTRATLKTTSTAPVIPDSATTEMRNDNEV